MKNWLGILTIALISSAAQAFPTTYHYFVTTDPAQLALDSQTHWDSEASSDFLTYQRPLLWDAAWYRNERVFDLSVGSISSKQFLTYQRMKLHADLTDNIEFRFHWLEERDFEQDRSDMPLELKYNFDRNWGVSIFGTPSLYKSEDDVGASIYYVDARWEYQASMVWGDFQRNKRNLAADEWSEAPVGITASALYLSRKSPREFLNAEVHWEPRASRTNGSTPLWDISQESISISTLQLIDNPKGFGGRILYDRAYHNDYAGNMTRTRKRALN